MRRIRWRVQTQTSGSVRTENGRPGLATSRPGQPSVVREPSAAQEAPHATGTTPRPAEDGGRCVSAEPTRMADPNAGGRRSHGWEPKVWDARADEAMERYARGDDRAFVEVYEALATPLYRLAVRALRDRALAEDIVQMTFLNIHRARGTFVEGGSVLPWAKCIARRLVLDALRGRARDRRWTSADIEGNHARVTPPDERVAATDTAHSIQAALARLPASQKEVLELRAQGLSLVVMARVLRTTVVAVKLRIHRALLALRTTTK